MHFENVHILFILIRSRSTVCERNIDINVYLNRDLRLLEMHIVMYQWKLTSGNTYLHIRFLYTLMYQRSFLISALIFS